MSTGILLAANEQLSAVIDFGGSCVADLACDLVMAWTCFDDESRIFKGGLILDKTTWKSEHR